MTVLTRINDGAAYDKDTFNHIIDSINILDVQVPRFIAKTSRYFATNAVGQTKLKVIAESVPVSGPLKASAQIFLPIKFPEAFSQPPIVVFTPHGSEGFMTSVWTGSLTITGFIANLQQDPTARTSSNLVYGVHYIAIGV